MKRILDSSRSLVGRDGEVRSHTPILFTQELLAANIIQPIASALHRTASAQESPEGSANNIGAMVLVHVYANLGPVTAHKLPITCHPGSKIYDCSPYRCPDALRAASHSSFLGMKWRLLISRTRSLLDSNDVSRVGRERRADQVVFAPLLISGAAFPLPLDQPAIRLCEGHDNE